MHAKIIAIAHRKGGCGKTASVTSLAAEFGLQGKRTLVIDADEQCTSGQRMLAHGLQSQDKTLYDVLFNEASLGSAIYEASDQYQNCFIMPTSRKFKSEDPLFASAISKETLIKRVVENLRENFDIIIIDGPAGLNNILTTVLVAADYFLIPLGFDISSLENVEFVLNEVKKIEKAGIGKPKYLGAFCTQYGQDRHLSTKDFDKIAMNVSGVLKHQHVPFANAWKRAEMRSTTLQNLRKNPVSIGYQNLVKYLTKECR